MFVFKLPVIIMCWNLICSSNLEVQIIMNFVFELFCLIWFKLKFSCGCLLYKSTASHRYYLNYLGYAIANYWQIFATPWYIQVSTLEIWTFLRRSRQIIYGDREKSFTQYEFQLLNRVFPIRVRIMIKNKTGFRT